MSLVQIVNTDKNGIEQVSDYSSPTYQTCKLGNFAGILMDTKIIGSGIKGISNLVKTASALGVEDLLYDPPMPNATIPTDMSGAPNKNLGWMHSYEGTTSSGREPELSFNNTENIIPSYTKKLIGENRYQVDVLLQTNSNLSEELLEITLNDVAVGVDDNKPFNRTLPVNPTLSQNYPNPFNPSTSAEYTLPKPSSVSINVYNVNGELVQNLFNGKMNSGKYRVEWDGKDSNGNETVSGMYLLQMRTPSGLATKKMVKLK
jgi:hypothetical protein